ncbi:MAG: TrmO family methyltransferase [Tabrizicola flagellatus]|uniref:TrmO family methyltransferase domain-containing protein n=1 Tax=Tabrizicola flagellatus TaxID=2593021 RepID=UPI00391C3CCB
MEFDAIGRPLLAAVAERSVLQVIYWLHLARRDLALQSPRNDGGVLGTFSLRSPMRPNPLGISSVRLICVDGTGVTVRGLDCVDGTPLIDLKPDLSIWVPRA